MKTLRLYSFLGLHPEYSRIRISFHADYNEYQVRMYDLDNKHLPDLTYYTTDRDDALSTAQHIFNTEILRQQALEIPGE